MNELLDDGMLPPVTANEQMMRQFARQRAGRTVLDTPQQALDLGAGMLGMVPIVGDAMGLAADLHRYETDPESRNWLNYGLTGLGLLPFMPGMTVFHGSPHKGIKQFDMNKVGTGEGAQAYGHGLYFAENPEVAGWYVKSTSATRDKPAFRGKAIEEIPGSEGAVAAQLHSNMNDLRLGDELRRTRLEDFDPDIRFNTAKKRLRDYLSQNNQLEELRYLDDMKAEDFGVLKHEGQLYKVDIPDDQIAKMLDWDAPLKDQPDSVKKAMDTLLSQLSANDKQYLLQMESRRGQFGNPTAGDIYQRLSVLKGGQREASEALNAVGIPGLKYHDQGSRDAGGTRNLVVFDDKLPKILDE